MRKFTIINSEVEDQLSNKNDEYNTIRERERENIARQDANALNDVIRVELRADF